MKFYLGLSVGLFLGLIIATGLSAFAQLAPFTGDLNDQLNGIRAEQFLQLERELERAEYDRSAYRVPCPR